MDGLTLFLLIIIGIVTAAILVFFALRSLKSAKSKRVDHLPGDQEEYVNPRDSSHDKKL